MRSKPASPLSKRSRRNGLGASTPRPYVLDVTTGGISTAGIRRAHRNAGSAPPCALFSAPTALTAGTPPTTLYAESWRNIGKRWVGTPDREATACPIPEIAVSPDSIETRIGTVERGLAALEQRISDQEKRLDRMADIAERLATLAERVVAVHDDVDRIESTFDRQLETFERRWAERWERLAETIEAQEQARQRIREEERKEARAIEQQRRDDASTERRWRVGLAVVIVLGILATIVSIVIAALGG